VNGGEKDGWREGIDRRLEGQRRVSWRSGGQKTTTMLPLANGNRRMDGLKTVIHVHMLTVLGVLYLVRYYYYYYYYCVLLCT